jgi:NTP pyrophosphatase (non-canonical NTP hydrolase)
MELIMKFILISRHTDGSEIPENDKEQNLKDMMAWMSLLNAEIAMPIRGGKSVTEKKVKDYTGDVGGLLIFEAENLDQAVALAKKSPGLKYGFTHEVFPEISMAAAANT